MKILSLLCCLMVASVLVNSCKFMETPTSERTRQSAVIPKDKGNGLAISGTGFVWERDNLPVCYTARVGVRFFVWKEQATFACDSKRQWSRVAKRG